MDDLEKAKLDLGNVLRKFNLIEVSDWQDFTGFVGSLIVSGGPLYIRGNVVR